GGYPEAVDYLTSLGRFGIKLGLERTEALLHALGDPHELFQGVHVAGTNGKGSVCAMVASILQSAGYRVGLMPKPHLIAYTERIQVDQRQIGEADFAALLTELQPIINKVAAELGPPTEFEILTSAALSYFARAGIDLLVCEVGVGGRLDCTNVLDLGVSVITNIALDHTRYLGSTLEAIAADKAGILKPDSIAISGAPPPALGVLEATAREPRTPLGLVDGAHTPARRDRSLAPRQKLAKGRPLVIVLAAMSDRDLPAMLALGRSVGAPVIFSRIGWHRAAPPTDRAKQFPGESETAESSTEALSRARERVGRDGIVLVCGSLYLVGEAITEARARDARGSRVAAS